MSLRPNSSEQLQSLLRPAGITLNGDNPWDPQIHDEQVYQRILGGGTLGAGESYVDGQWDCEQLDELICRALHSDFRSGVNLSFTLIANAAMAMLFNRQSKTRSKTVATEHYDLPAELYKSFLDTNMQYTCGYWRDADNLEDAQVAKMELIAHKLKLEPGMSVLDIGCGWGQLANHLAAEYDVDVTGITISREQLVFAQTHFDKPTYLLSDYRDLKNPGRFDRAVAVGMIEHVGYKNYRPFMKTVRNLLKSNGMFLLQTIGGNTSSVTGDPWVNNNIFPNGMTPSEAQLAAATEGVFVKENEHNFGADYDKTLMAWFEKFDANWPSLEGKLIDESDPSRGRYDEKFYRTWKYYFLMFAGTFRSRKVVQLWQNVYSVNGVPGGYEPVRE